MTHDIQDLLNLIKDLEERIIELEREMINSNPSAGWSRDENAWYWDH